MKIKIKCIDLDIYDQINDEFKNDTIAIYDTELNSVQFMGRKKNMREVFCGCLELPLWRFPEYGPVIPVNMIDIRVVYSVLNVIKELEALCLC